MSVSHGFHIPDLVPPIRSEDLLDTRKIQDPIHLQNRPTIISYYR